MTSPVSSIPRCETRSIIDQAQCLLNRRHMGPCSFGDVTVDGYGQRIFTERPDWLPDGHAFCPGNREEVRKRMFISSDAIPSTPGAPGETEPYSQMFYRCEHGSWDTQADAWTAHAPFDPGLKALTPSQTADSVIDNFINDLAIRIEQLRNELKALL